MNKGIWLLALVLVVLTMSPAVATSLTFTMGCPSGDPGQTQTFTNNNSSISIDATGYSKSGNGVDLYDNCSKSETGLGLNDNYYHLIQNNDFVQFDFADPQGLPINSVTFTITSIATNQGFGLYASTTDGVLGTLLTPQGLTTGPAKSATITISNPGVPFIDVDCTGVLVSAIALNPCPEPATFLVVGLAFLALGMATRGISQRKRG